MLYIHNTFFSSKCACHFIHLFIEDSFDMEFDIDEEWNDLFSDSTSVEFAGLSERVQEQVTFLFPKE